MEGKAEVKGEEWSEAPHRSLKDKPFWQGSISIHILVVSDDTEADLGSGGQCSPPKLHLLSKRPAHSFQRLC